MLFLLVFFIPFTGMKGLPAMGEMKGEFHVYPAILMVFLGVLYTILKLPKLNRSFLLMLIPFAVVVLGIFANYSNIISQPEFKYSDGLSRLFSQSTVLVFYLLVTYSLLVVFKKDSVETIVNVCISAIFSSFYVLSAYCIFEIPYVIGFDFTNPLLDMYSNVFRAEEYREYLRRLRGLSFEAPSLANYLSIVVVATIYRARHSGKKYWLLYLWIAVLISLSYSRTAILTIIIITLAYALFYGLTKSIKTRAFYFLISIFLFISIVLLDLSSGGNGTEYLISKIKSISIDTTDDYHLASNLGRWGSQYAAVAIGLDNWIFGVGIGQSGFYLPSYYPDWAFGSFQVRNWSNSLDPLWPPIFSIYTRIFSELGSIGLALFMTFNVVLILKLKSIITQSKNVQDKYLAVLLLSLMVLSLILFAQFGSFRLLIYWISIFLAMKLISEQRMRNE
ncbi:O-antigen ligase family protein [Ferrimonas balearica]|uniref:O-antigen ligase family protein n=1 Tax=Ferrimonas balearica TaxID=44012 RepID=UPI001C963C03|nr:O-antigen ligase family protein [Ferrimonas balearica]MBY6105282.1 O-antigen ligase family protein [Ferrimonas balearica]